MRKRLPDTRKSLTHKAVIRSGGDRVKFFITVGLYEDGRPGEIFLTFDQAGSTLDGWADAWATAVSICLQHGETIDNLVKKFSWQRFDPQGMTENEDIPIANSVVDYVMRWIKNIFDEETGTWPQKKS